MKYTLKAIAIYLGWVSLGILALCIALGVGLLSPITHIWWLSPAIFFGGTFIWISTVYIMDKARKLRWADEREE